MTTSTRIGAGFGGLLLCVSLHACAESTPAEQPETAVTPTAAVNPAPVQDTPAPAQATTAPDVPKELPMPTSAIKPADVGIELRNRLGEETSPYLLQHAANPVHWFAWGPEAFEAARRLNRPIFLSVGYSTCYWCHVMERECFEIDEVAAIMNELFVCIKVDREERPDVDEIYMAAVQMSSNGRGGWPMSVFLEPVDLKPFFGGTYFPPDDQPGRAGFKSIMRSLAKAWTDQNGLVMQQADQFATQIKQHLSAAAQPQSVSSLDIELAVAALLGAYDKQDAGFAPSANKAPKFPVPSTLDFLIGAAWDRPAVRGAVIHTLDRMATGGMYDQVGGGFHRYSTDRQWLVPHFEKMLYDNGQLVSTYADVYEREQDPYYAEIIRETLDYVLREMTDDGGGFYSAQDAEVNHREGQNYLWVDGELRSALAAAGLDDEYEFARQVYGLAKGTNFQDPHHPEDGPKNVLFLQKRPELLAADRGNPSADFDARLARINQGLLATRNTRDQPGTDDKILAGWNGLMIGGFADGGRVLDNPAYVDVAAQAADFVLRKMRTADGALLRNWRNGPGRVEAFFEDYALLVRGLIALHRATEDTQYVDEAIALVDMARTRFWDDTNGGFFDTLADQSDLFVRTRSTYDGAVPCGNSVMTLALLDLHEVTGETRFLDDATATIQALSAVVKTRPTSAVLTALAVHRMAQQYPERLGIARAVPITTTPEPVETAPVEPKEEPTPDFAPGAFVAMTFSSEQIEIPEGGEVSFHVTMHILPGHHMNAHETGMEFSIPMSFELIAGDGLELTVDYPAGERFSGPEGAVLVHHDRVRVPMTLKRIGPVPRSPRIAVTYQVCNDKVCFMPQTKPLDLRIVAK